MHALSPIHAVSPLGCADNFILQVLCSIKSYTDMCVSVMLLSPFLHTIPLVQSKRICLMMQKT